MSPDGRDGLQLRSSATHEGSTMTIRPVLVSETSHGVRVLTDPSLMEGIR
jgi:hypothetical protein